MAIKTWVGPSGATWNTAADWSTAAAPVLGDTADITNTANAYTFIAGTGSDSATNLVGSVAFTGTFSLGTLAVGASDVRAALWIGSGADSATSATLADGLIQVSGTAARLTVGGALTLGVARTQYDYGFTTNTLNALVGGAVQAGSLVLLGSTLVTNAVTVDATSSLEIGTVGGAAAGKLTIDSGRTVSGAGTISATSGIVNQGTLLATGGTLSLSGPISGAGQVQIAATGTLDLGLVTTNAETVAFNGIGGTLLLGTYRGPYVPGMPLPSLNQQGSVTGFAQGDTIEYAGPGAVTAATWSAATGLLTLYSGATNLGTLALSGNYAGYTFQVTPGSAAGAFNITLVTTPTGGSTTASPGTASRDSYAWASPVSGNWNTASNWHDLSTGQTPVAPGANDVVLLSGPTGSTYEVISGTANAAALTLAGNTTLSGAFTVGQLSVGTTSAAGALAIGTGSVVLAATASLLDGPALVSGAGAVLRVAQLLTLGAPASPFDYSFVINTLTLSAGGLGQADMLFLQASPLVTDTVSIDATSSLEIGETGGAAAGTLTIDPGKVLEGAGTIRPANGFINKGTILATGGILHLAGPITGTGTLQIAAGATLDISAPYSASTEALSFTGANATLLLGSVLPTQVINGVPVPSLTQRGTVSGFRPGDTVEYYGAASALTSVSWSAATGLLTLLSGATSLGTLALTGDYSNDAFQVSPDAAAYTYDITVSGMSFVTPSQGTATADAFSWVGPSGAWGTVSNWHDQTTGGAATVAAGAHDAVQVGPAVSEISGAGNSASLSITGNTELDGTFQSGAVTVGTNASAATLTLGAGATLAASSLSIASGGVQVAGNGADLAIGSAITMGGAGTLAFTSGGVGVVGSLALNGTLSLDLTSTLEVGAAGLGAPGRLTVDVGASISGSGSITAAGGVVDQGSITAQGTLVINSAVTGTGVLNVAVGGTLDLASTAASTASVMFDGYLWGGHNSGNLEIQSSGASGLNLLGSVSGFMMFDQITYTGAPLTAATYVAAGDGTGTLTLHTATGIVGTLQMVGNYSGYGFAVSAGPTPGTSQIQLVVTDPLFDTAYYLAMNPDVAAAGVDPYIHYIYNGWHENRNPDPYFDTDFYIKQNPDVIAQLEGPLDAGTGANPMDSFEQTGWAQGRQPSLMFSDTAYLAQNPDVAAAGVNPLVHYIEYGKAEGRADPLLGYDGNTAAADLLINGAYVDQQLGATLTPQGATDQAQAAELYNSGSGIGGWKTGINPDADFDTTYYLSHDPGLAASGQNPLHAFENGGWRNNVDPSLAFSLSGYDANNPDVAAANVDPLLHYVAFGQNEGRAAIPVGGLATPDFLIVASYLDKQIGASTPPAGSTGAAQAAWLYNDGGGWQEGLNPNAWFNTDYYLSHNPDVAAAHVNPLLHYEQYGWKEGRDPSAQFSTDKYLAAYPDVKASNADPLLHFIVFGQYEGRVASPV